MAQAKYRLMFDDPRKVWMDTETHESFGEDDDNKAAHAFKQWLKDGGKPDTSNMVQIPVVETKQTRGNLLSLHIKQALQDAKLQTPEAQKLANVLQQLADGVADLQRDAV
jgi:hypothetical protein